MSLRTPEKVRKLQEVLHAKAKESPKFRFYALYDKIYRADVLDYAYQCCKAKGGAAGVDGQTFKDIEEYGAEKWLGELAEDLRKKRYRPEAVRRVYIPKSDGKQRPLGIPVIRDRAVMTAAVLILEPIFEADLPSEQYAYRPDRSALDAVRKVHKLVNTGYSEVVDGDLKGYFDNIPHAELMKSVARRVSDKHVLRLIKMWLEAPVEETDDRGNKHRTTWNKDNRKGIPQGSPISPLLSNIYMRRFIFGWKVLGHEKRLNAHIINYADDYVICCRRTAAESDRVMRRMMHGLKLEVNEEKTRVYRVPEEPFDFLGYTIGRNYTPQSGKPYIGTRPARKKVKAVCGKIKEVTSSGSCLREVEEIVTSLNRILRGWSNYFCLGAVSKSYKAVDAHVRKRLRQWLCRKHKKPGKGISRYPDKYLYEELKLIRLETCTSILPWAKA